jgi:hypothetical protein
LDEPDLCNLRIVKPGHHHGELAWFWITIDGTAGTLDHVERVLSHEVGIGDGTVPPVPIQVVLGRMPAVIGTGISVSHIGGYGDPVRMAVHYKLNNSPPGSGPVRNGDRLRVL